MIVLDTNILSELMRPIPEPKVLAWLEKQTGDILFTTAISRGEMLYGAQRLPAGKRRDEIFQEIEAIFSTDMAGRVLPYDEAAADAHAELAALRRAQGRPSSQSDMMIVGIVRSHGARLATRNVRDFEGCGIALVDPWH
ncbi:type II toxin-antitoxin system VapC family toxin [Azorhizophilus paspali]|uniref:Ribonuclease VapC n=1 Tax=Azorhizophilus paspali TaxID=69963 RepID=A0ABV6SQ30_AZOPA